MENIDEIPDWMVKYIPFILQQFDGNPYHIAMKSEIDKVKESLPKSIRFIFAVNINIKIQFLKILKEQNLIS